mgnify:FL=1
MPKSSEDKITNYVTKAVAEEWRIDDEPTIFFVEVLAQLDINVGDRFFDALQDHFEATCETILSEARFERQDCLASIVKARAWDAMYNQHTEDNFPNGEYPASAWHQIELMDGYLKRAISSIL